MGFHTKYELEKLVHDGPVKTFQAKEIASGKPVFLHLLSDELIQSNESLIDRTESLRRLSESAAQQPVLEIGPANDYVATEVLESFQGLENWVDTAYARVRDEARDRLSGDMRSQIASGDVAAALQIAQQGILNFPEDAEFTAVTDALALLEESRQLTQQGEAGPSIDRLADAIQIDPGNPLILGALLLALPRRAQELSTSHPNEASELVRQALELDPVNEAALAVRQALDPEREEFAAWCLSQADKLHQQGDPQGALAVLEQGIAKCPDDQALRRKKTELSPRAPSPNQPPAQPTVQPVKPAPVAAGLSTPTVLRRQAGQGARAVGSGLSHLAATLREKAPALAANVSKLDKKSPLVPAVVGAGLAVLLIPLFLLFSDTDAEAEAPPPILGHTVAVTSNPPGAALLVNGESCGTSDCEVTLEPGTHFAEATLAGYRPTMVSFEVGADGVAEPILLTLPPRPPTIRVSSDLANGTVELDDETIGQLEEGEFEQQISDLSSGEHTLTIKGSGTTTEITFTMEPASLPAVIGAPRTHEVRALVVAGFGSMAKLYGDQEISAVQLDDNEADDAAAEPVLEWNDLAGGAHQLQVTSSGKYGGGKSGKVIFDSQPSPVLTAFVQSDRNVGGLRINTGEDNVAIYLNGEQYRRTTRRGRLLIYLYPKTYKVRAEKAGFRPTQEQTIDVKKGEQVSLDFTLGALPTTATLRIKDGVPGTEVLLDGSLLGVVGPEGTLSVSSIEPGGHTISFRKEKFRPREIKSEFVANATVDMRGMLESALGTLRIELTPADAEARLTLREDGESTERPISSDTLQLDAGTYTVSASAEGFQDYGATVRLEAEETKTVRIALQPIVTPKIASPTFQLSDWEKAGGWLREGNLLVRTGGNQYLAPFEPQPGVYEFSVQVRQGRRLEWVVDFHSEDSHIHYQIGRNDFERSHIVAGKRTEHVKKPHAANFNDSITVRIDVGTSVVKLSLYEQDKWVEIDRFQAPGVNVADGKFGFHLPGRRQIAVRRMTFTPR